MPPQRGQCPPTVTTSSLEPMSAKQGRKQGHQPPLPGQDSSGIPSQALLTWLQGQPQDVGSPKRHPLGKGELGHSQHGCAEIQVSGTAIPKDNKGTAWPQGQVLRVRKQPLIWIG